MEAKPRYYSNARLIFGLLFLLSICLLAISFASGLFSISAFPAAIPTSIAIATKAPAAVPTAVTQGTPAPGPVVTSTAIPAPTSTSGSSGSAGSSDSTSFLIGVVVPLATSFLSLVGFVSTTVLAWRKERRDVAIADLEHQRQLLELEKARLELERIKREHGG